jgi:hypothetical protein
MKPQYYIIIPLWILFGIFILTAFAHMWDSAIYQWKNFGSKTEVILATILTLSFISIFYGALLFIYA